MDLKRPNGDFVEVTTQCQNLSLSTCCPKSTRIIHNLPQPTVTYHNHPESTIMIHNHPSHLYNHLPRFLFPHQHHWHSKRLVLQPATLPQNFETWPFRRGSLYDQPNQCTAFFSGNPSKNDHTLYCEEMPPKMGNLMTL